MREADREAFALVFDEHVERVYAYIGYRVRARSDVEDLTQGTFERACRSWARFDPSRGSVATWLLAIAGNLVIDHVRSQRPRALRSIGLDEVQAEAERATSVPAPEVGIDPDLEAVLSRLGERELEVVALRFAGDLTGQEIAEVTGLSVANVHQVSSRAIRKLRRGLELAHPEAGASGQPAAKGPTPATPSAARPISSPPSAA